MDVPSQYDLLEEKWSNFLTRFRPCLLNAGVTVEQLENATLHNALVALTFVAPFRSTINAASTGDFQSLQTLISAAAAVLNIDRERIENAWSALPLVSDATVNPSKTLFWRYVRFFLDSINTAPR